MDSRIKLDFESLTIETFDPQASTVRTSDPYAAEPDTEDKLCTETACHLAAAGFLC